MRCYASLWVDGWGAFALPVNGFVLVFRLVGSILQKKTGDHMNRLATLLTGAALVAAQSAFAQMGPPDAKPVPGMPGVAGPLAAKYGADAARILKAGESDEDGYEALTYLCYHVGKRLSGTPQL